MMDTIDARPAGAERKDDLRKVKLERGFYNIINGKKVAASKRLSVINPVTKKQLVAVPDVDHGLLNRAISGARHAFSEWGAVSFGRRKVILGSLLSKIEDHADELSALLTAEQGGPLAQARGNRSTYPSVWTGPHANGSIRERKRSASHKADYEAFCPDRRRRSYQPMEFASYTFIWEGTPSLTDW